MDTQILIDALAVIMGHEEKELCKPGNLALVLILETATSILGSKERVGINTGDSHQYTRIQGMGRYSYWRQPPVYWDPRNG
ncbi:hypothetical protein DPMN_149479 [Dreissena polymorpha]|uniref:Uncharacterized protein n=1 Tax=Dreissena polymorpha TaxID=45954 RepID=A0A9D4FHG8_DREPO|nr:hypothetical protein DPMN_149479 [Dreissena polymorpha]